MFHVFVNISSHTAADSANIYAPQLQDHPHLSLDLPTECYRSRLASLSHSSRHNTSPTLTGPLTFLMIVRLSSRNSTRTYSQDCNNSPIIIKHTTCRNGSKFSSYMYLFSTKIQCPNISYGVVIAIHLTFSVHDAFYASLCYQNGSNTHASSSLKLRLPGYTDPVTPFVLKSRSPRKKHG